MKRPIGRLLSYLFPSTSADLGYRVLTSPQVMKLRDHELLTLNKSTQSDLAFNNFTIRTYEWKRGEDKVLLVHGWEGQAGNFADLIEKLIAKNYTVYAFDGPSHGFSSKGSTSLFEFIELVEILIRKYEVKKLISHSFGGVATTYSLHAHPDLEIDKYALITTPDRFVDRIDSLSKLAGFSSKAQQILIDRLEAEIGLKVETLNVSDFVKTMNVKNGYIIHDKKDVVIPIEQSRRVHHNWPNSTMEEVEGTGHFRILRTEEVLEKVLAFMG